MKRGFLITEKAKAKLVADTDLVVQKDKGKAKAETYTDATESKPSPPQSTSVMKRGFLNTEKAKAKLTADTDLFIQKDKGKAKAETFTDAIESKHTPPLVDLHSVPSSVRTFMKYPTDRRRFIFRHWPRDPNGKVIVPSDIHGKEAGNALDLWGATLYDFYFVRRIPSNIHGQTISTGSKLAKVMKSFGELEHAEHEIAWAAREAYPKEIPAWDPAEAIMAHERRVHAGLGIVNELPVKRKRSTVSEIPAAEPKADVEVLGASDPVGQVIESNKDAVEGANDSAEEPSGKSADPKDGVGVQQPPSTIPVGSPFHPDHYPSPWPLVPFESPYPPFHLQQRIPIHLLPQKLYVHDPWELADTDSNIPSTSLKGESWTSKTDYIRTYTLSLPHEWRRKAEDAAKAAATAEDEALETPETTFISPQETGGPTEQPAIRAFLPKRPRKLTEVPEAHLYLSPKGRLGTGNHSVVYEAELELPRDLFCQSTYCETCLDEQIKVEVNRLKESGEWEQRMSEATKEYQATKSGGSPSSSSVQIPPGYVGFVTVRVEHVPMETVDMVVAAASGETSAEDAPSYHFGRVSDAVTKRYSDYEGPVVPLYPNVQWQNPAFPDTICEHEVGKKRPVPRTAKFRVAAKLSLPGDPHLEREAKNYLKFPDHFFQHWTGYNVVPPLHDPTPVGALVPQFFGYYTPDALPGSNDEDGYCSPILLIEHCGKPICVDKLSTDDRHECVALLFRFHSAWWLHESFAERNILQQRQHPTCNPLKDRCECDFPHQYRRYSFRLIDFGRSLEHEDASRRCVEEAMGKCLFHIL